MLPSSFLGLLAGLTSAFVWGSGDFVGGLAARRSTQFQVVMLSALSGLVILTLSALIQREPMPSAATMAWACAAGLSGAVGVAGLYRGLATGSAAVVAPASAVVAAIIPVITGSVLEGLPTLPQLVGILLGLIGIYLVSQPQRGPAGSPDSGARELDRLGDETTGNGILRRPGLHTLGLQRIETADSGRRGRSELALGLSAGAGFGGFFVFIAQVESGPVFAPLAFAKLAAFMVGTLVLAAQSRRAPGGNPQRDLRERNARALLLNPLALLAGVLDAGGNLFYLIALQYIPLAIAGVLSSMYPASTVILSIVLLGQKIRRFQMIGVLVCLVAVALITF
jgi:drug/metabolite transporter (DMT)-like permease